MIRLTTPTDDNTAAFRACYQGFATGSKASLVARFAAAEESINKLAESYNSLACTASLYTLDSHEKVGEVTGRDMTYLYTYQFVQMAGRPIYNRLRNSAPYGICPFCAERTVTTLDHYLSKSKYPAYAVHVQNLVPSCYDCNRAKLDSIPSSENEMILHPYYDDFSGERWLACQLVVGTPLTTQFEVAKELMISKTLRDRLERHLRLLGLESLYSTKATIELSDISLRLGRLFDVGGQGAIRDYLKEESDSRDARSLSSWGAALYHTLANSDWFCEEGFSMIE